MKGTNTPDKVKYIEKIIKETKFQNKANNAVKKKTKTQVSDVFEGKKEKIELTKEEIYDYFTKNKYKTPQENYDYFTSLSTLQI